MSSDHAKPSGPLAVIQDYSLPLIFGVLAAVTWANLDMHSYEHLLHWHPLHGDDHAGGGHGLFKFIVDDLFMALFFGIAAKEITEACLPGGDLSSPAKAANPLMGTLGGVVGPVAVYLAYCKFMVADPELGAKIAGGWGVPTATDIALAWLIARLAFGNSHPAVKYLLLLAVADDAIGLGIIAIFYSSGGGHEPQWHMLTLVAVGMAVAYGLRKMKVTNFWVYLLIPGALSWAGLFTAHLHPALALVPIVPFMPSKGFDAGLYKEQETPEKFDDTLDNFEHFFKTPVDYGLFCFGLANAGVAFSVVGDATWAVLGALIIGKTVGIFFFSYLGHLIGLSLPDGMDLRTLFVAGLTAGLGLTVALFVAGVAYPGEVEITGAAKMGALLSAFVGPLVLIVAKLLKIKKIN